MKLLVTGVTGYIGGSVARRLVRAGHEVRGLVRSSDAAPAVEALGVTPVIADLGAYEPVREAVRGVEGVVHAADSDHAHFVATVLDALDGTGKLFVHTSGSSIVADKAMGEPSSAVHDTLPSAPRLEKAGRVAIDRAIVSAADRGIRSVVICPTMIYGEGLGLKKESIQIPLVARAARAEGFVPYIGRGLNVWSNVHIADLVELYALAVEKGRPGSFYFAENGEASLGEIARALHARLALPGTARSITIDRAIGLWGPEAAQFALGSNSRVSARRAQEELGWSPTRRTILETL